MIKDIGIEGLRVDEPAGAIIDEFNNGGKLFVLPAGCKMEMIDVTTCMDTEPRLIEGFSGQAMLEHMTNNTGPM